MKGMAFGDSEESQETSLYEPIFTDGMAGIG